MVQSSEQDQHLHMMEDQFQEKPSQEDHVIKQCARKITCMNQSLDILIHSLPEDRFPLDDSKELSGSGEFRIPPFSSTLWESTQLSSSSSPSLFKSSKHISEHTSLHMPTIRCNSRHIRSSLVLDGSVNDMHSLSIKEQRRRRRHRNKAMSPDQFQEILNNISSNAVLSDNQNTGLLLHD